MVWSSAIHWISPRSLGRHSHNVHAQVPSYDAPWFQLLPCCSTVLSAPCIRPHALLMHGPFASLPRYCSSQRDWSVVLTSAEPRLIAWHSQATLPTRQAALLTLFSSPSPKSSVTVLLLLLPHGLPLPVSAHADANPDGGTTTVPTLWLQGMVPGVTFAVRVDHSHFRIKRQQFHRIVRHFRSVYWDDWLCRAQSLSHRDPRLAAAYIRRTFRSTAASPDLCNMQWPGADRSVLSQRDALAQWRTHFALAATSSEFSHDFFISISRRFTSLTSPRLRWLKPFLFKLLFAHAGAEVFLCQALHFGDAKFETMAAEWKSSRVDHPRGSPAPGVVARVARPSPTISPVAASAVSSARSLQSQRSPSRMWFRVRRLRAKAHLAEINKLRATIESNIAATEARLEREGGLGVSPGTCATAGLGCRSSAGACSSQSRCHYSPVQSSAEAANLLQERAGVWSPFPPIHKTWKGGCQKNIWNSATQSSWETKSQFWL